MCFAGQCPHERWDGTCGAGKNDICPASFESDEDYWEAMKKASQKCDDPSDWEPCHS